MEGWWGVLQQHGLGQHWLQDPAKHPQLPLDAEGGLHLEPGEVQVLLFLPEHRLLLMLYLCLGEENAGRH